MRYLAFHIHNFRGVDKVELRLDRSPSNIHALVGLNESGKTTVLEALFNFRSNPDLLKPDPSTAGRSERLLQSMIPIRRRANFSDQIQITAQLQLDFDDWEKIDAFMKAQFGFAETAWLDEISVSHIVKYENSKYVGTENQWAAPFHGKKGGKGRRKWTELHGEEWKKVATFASDLLPAIVYFPAALLEFPERIILSGDGKKTERNIFYCEVVGDILKAIDPTLTIHTHLISRAQSTKPSDRQNLQALLLKIEQNLTKTVFEEWEKIFGHKLQGKQFRVSLAFEENTLSLHVKIVEQDGVYSINERSAGFRWFFAFILLTQYRVHRGSPVLFLFDEPASNLHPNAQSQLLKSFELVASGRTQIIYSTHSHYLVNPKWLDSTNIVVNAAFTDSTAVGMESPEGTSITVAPYRRYVGSHPEQYFYYQPVMKVLDYSPSPIGFPETVALIEGKTDFFLLSYFALACDVGGSPLFPGGGAGSLDVLISLLAGWGKRFVVLVDSDSEGLVQIERYRTKFEQTVDGRLFSLADIEVTWTGHALESLIQDSDKELIRDTCFPEQPVLTKKLLHRGVQELIANKQLLSFSDATLSNFKKVSEFLQERLETTS